MFVHDGWDNVELEYPDEPPFSILPKDCWYHKTYFGGDGRHTIAFRDIALLRFEWNGVGPELKSKVSFIQPVRGVDVWGETVSNSTTVGLVHGSIRQQETKYKRVFVSSPSSSGVSGTPLVDADGKGVVAIVKGDSKQKQKHGKHSQNELSAFLFADVIDKTERFYRVQHGQREKIRIWEEVPPIGIHRSKSHILDESSELLVPSAQSLLGTLKLLLSLLVEEKFILFSGAGELPDPFTLADPIHHLIFEDEFVTLMNAKIRGK